VGTVLRAIKVLASEKQLEGIEMKLPAPTEGGSFERPPAGMFPAICYRIIDIGTQLEEYNGETKLKRKVIIYWELHDPEATMSDGRPMSISKRYTYSMHEKATLRHHLESWRGKKFADAECAQFDIENVLGQACYLSVIETISKKTGNPYSAISNVNKPPRNFEMPPQVNESTFLGLTPADFDKVVFDGLGERLKAMIESSREYKAIMNGKAPEQENPAHDLDDEIPF
jgi:hypothetical protein